MIFKIILIRDSSKISKFFALYGAPGSGKGTILDVITKLFAGYYSIIDISALGRSSAEFSTSVFKDNPLVGIEYDSDLSHIENNTRLNSIVSHEIIPVRELYKSSYPIQVNTMLFLATNSPITITDAKSGIIRRLIEVTPSGARIPNRQYNAIKKKIDFQLGAIAKHCKDIYESLGINYYDSYRSKDMMERTNLFFNFMEESYFSFKQDDCVTLKRAWDMYKTYLEDAGLRYTMPKYKFKQELSEYFKTFTPDSHDSERNKENIARNPCPLI